jgi:hypothetical protein
VDTAAPTFTDPSAWDTLDTSPLWVDDAGQSQTRGFFGGAFDGRYLYLVPWSNGSFDGVAVRYDTMADFRTSTSWSSYAIPTPYAKGFQGAVFDGRWIYYIDSGVYLARFDTRGPFTAPTSWSAFQMSSVNPGPLGFATGIFDGRYVYLVPNGQLNNWSGLISRFDTTASFALAGSYATFDVASVESDLRGFFGGAFDGRYVYLAPYENGAAFGKVARYDTQAAFGALASWSSFDTGRLADAGAAGYSGALFDGRYVYFVPYYGTVAVRFDAKEPASMPSGYSGSFY